MTMAVAVVALVVMAVTMWARGARRRETVPHEPRRREPETRDGGADDSAMIGLLAEDMSGPDGSSAGGCDGGNDGGDCG